MVWLVCCGVVSVVREWVAGFNMVYVWVGLWVDRFVVVGVGLVDFFFFVVGCGGGGGCGCVCVAVMYVCSEYIILL